MKTKFVEARQRLLSACGLLAVCAVTAAWAGAPGPAARIPAEINSAELAPLKNSLHPMAQARYDAGRLPADTRLGGITLTFSRTAAQEADLRSLMAAQQNPASPLYHQWLTPDQFAARFGMADADLAKVESWLEEQGFSVDRVARSKNAIHFSGTAAQVERAFTTEMHIYKINGTQHFAPSTALSVPAALAPAVLGITNLDDFRPHAHVILSRNSRPKPHFTSSESGDVYFAPGDIATAYDISPLYNASVTGSGQSITLVGQSAIQTSDIEAFQSAAGLNVKDPTQFLVPDSGASTINGVAQQGGDEAESDIDLEWSGAIAPGATINFVYTGNNANYGAFDALQYAIDEKIGTIISSSYGECEPALSGGTLGSGAPIETTLEAALEQATTQGQTVMSAAGDDGSTDCYGEGLSTSVAQAASVDYPASSAYVTGMGGTEISSANPAYDEADTAYWAAEGSSDVISSALQYIPEMVWNDDAYEGDLSAGGGGTSALFQKPAWQTGVPGLSSSITMREVPDLALYASPSFPSFLYCSSDTSAWQGDQESSCTSGFRDSSSGLLTVAGGTSFDGPIFSGILALINQKQGYSAGQGLINPTLYTLAADSSVYSSAFHDITTGNNYCLAGSPYCPSNGSTLGFAATTGYDEASGLGSVDATNLAAAWPASSSGPSTAINTTTTITASSTAPNVGVSDTFTITVAPATGTVTPTGTITLTVDSNAPITETLANNGTYVYTTSFTTAGAHTILASYAGDSAFAASSGSVTVNVAVVSSGTGTIALTPAPSPSTLSVAQGNTGTETISITPAGGYTGTVELNVDAGSSDNALQNLCVSFTNMNNAELGTLPISGPGVQTTQLILDTNASDCVSEAASRKTGMQPLHRLHPGATAQLNPAAKRGSNPVPLTAALAGLLLAGFLGRGSRKLRGLAGLVLLAAVGFAATACSGGVYNNTPTDPPTGTYTMTVTAQDSANANIAATPATFTFVITAAQ